MKIKIDDDFEYEEYKEELDCKKNENIITYESYEVENVKPTEEKSNIRGKIEVICKLGSNKGRVIPSSKINLYMLNGISPRVVSSKLTNENGKVVFDNLKQGSYRVIAIVDRKLFQKPTYLQWNEVTINEEGQKEAITVINKLIN